MSNRLLTDENWEALWFVGAIMSYKRLLEDECEEDLQKKIVEQLNRIEKKIENIEKRLDKL